MVQERVMQGRIDRVEALRLLTTAPLIELMARAHAARMAWHPRRDVTFVVDTNPNYTNVCTTACTFCSFFRRPGAHDAYTLSPTAVARNAQSAYGRGATTILLQGGHHPSLGIEYYVELINSLRAAVPAMHLHLFSPAEIDHVAQVSGLDARAVLQRFHDLGLRTMPGGGAEILVERVRREISPKKLSAAGWLDIMRAAHEVGFKTSATMTYGHRESPDDIVDHLLRLRELQDETNGFYAFIPWSFKPGVSALAKLAPEAASPGYYVRIIALSRLVLDNVPHIQASWFGEGARAGQLALQGGADDFGGVLLEENVLFQANHREASSLNTVLRLIRESGFTPVQRSTPYRQLRRYDVPTPGEDELAPPARAAGAGALIPARALRAARTA